jgi:hypothetical protein
VQSKLELPLLAQNSVTLTDSSKIEIIQRKFSMLRHNIFLLTFTLVCPMMLLLLTWQTNITLVSKCKQMQQHGHQQAAHVPVVQASDQ